SPHQPLNRVNALFTIHRIITVPREVFPGGTENGHLSDCAGKRKDLAADRQGSARPSGARRGPAAAHPYFPAGTPAHPACRDASARAAAGAPGDRPTGSPDGAAGSSADIAP